MIALTDFEKRSLKEVFPEQCPKATPDPEFLSNLYNFDISMCPHQTWKGRIFRIAEVSTAVFDSINSSSSVPRLLVWMQGQVCQTIVILFTFIDTSIEKS